MGLVQIAGGDSSYLPPTRLLLASAVLEGAVCQWMALRDLSAPGSRRSCEGRRG